MNSSEGDFVDSGHCITTAPDLAHNILFEGDTSTSLIDVVKEEHCETVDSAMDYG